MTMLSESIKSLIDIRNQIKTLEKQAKDLSNTLIAEHQKKGLDILLEDGYQSTICHACRKTPLVPVIEKMYGKLPDECFKHTTYDTIKTVYAGTNMLNESSDDPVIE